MSSGFMRKAPALRYIFLFIFYLYLFFLLFFFRKKYAVLGFIVTFIGKGNCSSYEIIKMNALLLYPF